MNYELHHGDCVEWLRGLPDKSVDAVISDPPYAEVSRDYGRLSEADWHTLMRAVVGECKRVLKPHGSAIFVLQPNFESIGKTRTWVWEFMVWVSREWNLIQDVYWWNFTAIPSAGCERKNGLLRRSVKTLVWCGPRDCYRNQDAVLWEQQAHSVSETTYARSTVARQSGHSMRDARARKVAAERGGSTPFNLIPIPATSGRESGSDYGHSAATPYELCHWLVSYLSKPDGLVIDPFTGSGTTGVACMRLGRRFAGAERDDRYHALAKERLDAEASGISLRASRAGQQSLFGGDK